MFNPITIVQQTRAMPGSSGEAVRKASSVVFRVAGGPLLPGVKPLVYTELVKMIIIIKMSFIKSNDRVHHGKITRRLTLVLI